MHRKAQETLHLHFANIYCVTTTDRNLEAEGNEVREEES
jgi:hypothetical protein